jgi:nucleoside-diphosphate-sugar epimerase
MVGSRVAERLLKEGEQPVLFDVAFSIDNLRPLFEPGDVPMVRGDILEFSELWTAIKEHHVEAIIHTAGFLTSGVRERHIPGVKVNFVGTLNVLEAARLAGIQRVVYTGSGTAMSGLKSIPDKRILEDFPLHVVSEAPTNLYATAKLAGEWLCINYHQIYGMSTVVTRLGGPWGPWIGAPSGGPARLIKEVIDQTWRRQPIRLSARDARQGMDFVYAPDVAQALVRAARHPNPPSRVYNISNGTVYSPTEILSMLTDKLGYEGQLADDSAAEGSYTLDRIVIDISRARAELGYDPEYSMSAALDDYLAWLGRTEPRD